MASLLTHDRLAGDVSRHGEYTRLTRLLRADTPRIIVDVGAYGKGNSNSWNLISECGWRGVLVEASLPHAELCRREFLGDVTVVCKAISNEVGMATLYPCSVRGWASLDPAWISHNPSKRARHKVPIRVPTTTLPVLLEELKIPHRFGVLSVDIEGCDDRAVLPLLDSPWRPDFLLYEDGSRRIDPNRVSAAGYRKLTIPGDNNLWQREPTIA